LENERLLKQVRVLQWTHWMGIHLTANRVWSHSHQAGPTLSHRRVPTRSHRGFTSGCRAPKDAPRSAVSRAESWHESRLP
jgi:hypothetical protein